MDKEPSFLRYVLVAVILVFGGTGLAMHFYQPHYVIREALMAPPPEMQQQAPPPEYVPTQPTQQQKNERLIQGMNSLAGKVQHSLK
jgi:hypothetical protein